MAKATGEELLVMLQETLVRYKKSQAQFPESDALIEHQKFLDKWVADLEVWVPMIEGWLKREIITPDTPPDTFTIRPDYPNKGVGCTVVAHKDDIGAEVKFWLTPDQTRWAIKEMKKALKAVERDRKLPKFRDIIGLFKD